VIALHGGGEFVAGDEPAMDALLGAALEAAAVRASPAAGGARPSRIAIVPTAAARHRPEVAAGHGVRAFESAARRAGTGVTVEPAMVVDEASAHDADLAARLEGADLVHLPGGDPDLIPTVLAGTPAWAAILRAYAAGACVAGASAGAMALCERLWTSRGAMDGLAVVPGIAVLPHFAPGRVRGWRSTVDPGARLAWIGLEEQTLVVGRPGGSWRVAGAGRAYLLPPGSDEPTIAAAPGEPFPIAPA
jgi:cyanophycinase